jgi:glutathione synthase/RimK-type ligase-like ATP-grasp enzyme
MTILLWGVSGDRPLHAVAAELSRLGAQFVLLDQRDVLATAVDLRVDCQIRGSLRTPDWAAAFGEITAAYLRPDDPRVVPAVAAAGPGSVSWEHALRVNLALLSWAEFAPARIVNRPGASAANGSKPYQAELIRRHGFAVPVTLITTDGAAVRDFWERHGAVIYKSVSAIRSVVTRLTAADLDRLPDVACCPTMFQAYVPGEDIRVHVVGDELFACAIASAADDYRYPGPHQVAIRPYALPADVGDRCRAMVAAMGLAVAGVDLRCSPVGEWTCFEVNPSPAFTYYAQTTDQPIGQAIARLLVSGGCSTGGREPPTAANRATSPPADR